MNITDELPQRQIGNYSEGHPGPLVFVIAAMHGNEWAGIRASRLLLKMLEVEHVTNPDFKFRGKLIAIVGNLAAASLHTRFIDADLNRIWQMDRIAALLQGESTPEMHEEKEMMAFLQLMTEEIRQAKPEKIVIIDLHTTSAKGGIFAVPSESHGSLELARSIHAPVVKGMIGQIQGAALQYFDAFQWQFPAAAISFEAGEHNDPEAVYVAIAAVVNLLRNSGSIAEEDVENRHLTLLANQSAKLPKVSTLKFIYKVQQPGNFRMLPGYVNFQEVKKNELLAYDGDVPVHCPFDARILMPLYQKKGNDGFFLVSVDKEFGYFE
jgi:succinylglutamate desuccinylase